MRDARVDLTLATPARRSPYLTYEPYYGLKEKAFSLSADPRFLYKSRTHAPASPIIGFGPTAVVPPAEFFPAAIP